MQSVPVLHLYYLSLFAFAIPNLCTFSVAFRSRSGRVTIIYVHLVVREDTIRALSLPVIWFSNVQCFGMTHSRRTKHTTIEYNLIMRPVAAGVKSCESEQSSQFFIFLYLLDVNVAYARVSGVPNW